MDEGQGGKRRIGVLIEEHFDETEFRRFNEFFPQRGYEVEYLTRLWGNDSLTFRGNDFTEQVTVTTDLDSVEPEQYDGIILIGGYAMDRLRYQENPRQGEPNRSPAVEFLRKAVRAMDEGNVKIGTICHSMWLFCADPSLLKGRRVTCAHNIVPDVENAGGEVVYDGDQTAETHIEGGLISGRHPGVVDRFVEIFVEELEKGSES